MSAAVIKECWNIILNSDKKRLEDSRLPLAGIDAYLSYFELLLFPALEATLETDLDIRSPEPAFKNLTEEILLGLRHRIYTRTELDVVAVWAETLLRFCEVRFTSLRKRAMDKWKANTTARLNMLHLSAFLMDYCILTKDIRFLNTVLKLSDLKWVFRRGLKTDLRKGNIPALFQFRVALMAEYVIRQLEQGRWYE